MLLKVDLDLHPSALDEKSSGSNGSEDVKGNGNLGWAKCISVKYHSSASDGKACFQFGF